MKPLFLLSILLIANNFVYTQSSPPYIEWEKCIGGTGNEKGNAIIKTNDGGYIVAGSSTSNDGDVTGHHGSTDSLDAWIVKISSGGDIVWQRSFGGSGVEAFEKVIALSDGSFMCYGSTSSNDGDVSGNHGKTDLWVVKIDKNGTLLWQKCLGGSGMEYTGNMRQNSDGSFFIIGTTGSNDGDITSNPPFLGKIYTNIWFIKLSANGDIIQQNSIGGVSGDDWGYDIIETTDGTRVMAAYLTTPEEVFPAASNDPYGLVVKFAASSPFLTKWMVITDGSIPVSLTPVGDHFMTTYRDRQCGGAATNYRTLIGKITPVSIYLANLDYVGVFGSCTATPNWYGYYPEGPNNYAIMDSAHNHMTIGTYDTVAGVSSPHGDYDGFLGSFSINGNLNWKNYIGGSGKDFLTGIVPISETEFIVTGYTNSNDGDVTGNHGGFDIWVVKYGTGNQVKGIVFADMNSNGIKEINEPFINNAHVETVKGNSISKSLTKEGKFHNSVDSGSHVTRIVNSHPFYSTVPSSHTSSFPGYNMTDSISFALQPIAGKKDLQIDLFPITTARPGSHIVYNINYANTGTVTLANGTITFIKDQRLNFLWATPTPSSANEDTLKWTINDLAPWGQQSISLSFMATIPPQLNLNDTLISQVLIDSAGDLTPFNNFTVLRQQVRGSYDPNDKQEIHGGFLLENEYNSGSELLYTVRFQNTGNDTAFRVLIRDTLDAKLDWNSLEVIGASHNYIVTIQEGNKIKFDFQNIILPDSNVNEPASHGYLTYRIKPLSTLQVGDVIANSASIYFDYNLPVRTNIQSTVLKPAAPPVPQLAGLQSNYCSSSSIQKVKVSNLPAAGSGITVSVKIDGNAVPVAADSTFTLDPGMLAAGAHSILVQFTNISASKINAANFTITAAVNADVNLSANITTITNLATPVTVTAVNAANGGTNPLYTFARNRNFTDIGQDESANISWTFDPSLLAIGDNKIYVRMRSNATCVVSSTVVDSILIIRSSVTGITDPDAPGQMINIYPNPFEDHIFINGLNPSKSYTIRLSNIEGQVLQTMRVTGRLSISIPRRHYAKGTYLLSIFDEKRKQLLGTVKMTRN